MLLFILPISTPSFTLWMSRSLSICSSLPRRRDSGNSPARWSFAIFRLSALSFFFLDLTIHASSVGWATVMSV